MVSDTLCNLYVARMLSAEEKNRLSELRNILSELDLGIRLRKITEQQKQQIIYKIKYALENNEYTPPIKDGKPLDVLTRGVNGASNDDLVDLIAMLNRGRN